MTYARPAQPTPPPIPCAPRPQPTAQPRIQPRIQPSGPAVFGTLFMEVVTPGGVTGTPTVPGWILRAWPVARLGDITLEARPDGAHTPDALRAALATHGYRVLGPIRERR